MKKYVCINYYCYNDGKKYIDTWWYDVSFELALDDLAQDLAYFKLNKIKYNLYEVER